MSERQRYKEVQARYKSARCSRILIDIGLEEYILDRATS